MPGPNAVGLLHAEMRRLGSLIMRCADANQVPAGGALAVDRDGFAAAVTAALEGHPLITIERGEVDGLPPEDWDSRHRRHRPAHLAGPGRGIRGPHGRELARLLRRHRADRLPRSPSTWTSAWFQSRYDKAGPGGSGADYINCPLDRGAVRSLRRRPARGREDRVQGLGGEHALFRRLPADRGDGGARARDAAARPDEAVRPDQPAQGGPAAKAYAVVQLRQDNALGTLYNMVGFQTKLKHAEQVRLFRTIPGLENAEFARLGGLHRNTYLNSPRLLDPHAAPQGAAAAALRRPDHRLRGLCGKRRHGPAGRPVRGRRARWAAPLAPPPPTTALGALLNHITGGHIETIDDGPPSFQPMNVNFGLFPPLRGADRARTASACADRPRPSPARRALTDAGARRHGRPGRRTPARPLGAAE